MSVCCQRLLVNHVMLEMPELESGAEINQRLGVAQQQKTSGVQPLEKVFDDTSFPFLIEVNDDIAAKNRVHLAHQGAPGGVKQVQMTDGNQASDFLFHAQFPLILCKKPFLL